MLYAGDAKDVRGSSCLQLVCKMVMAASGEDSGKKLSVCYGQELQRMWG
jgi:hypothetical protein